MTFLILLGVIAVAYFAWRVSDQIPDVIYRLGEIQRDVAELRRAVEARSQPAEDADDGEDEAGDDD